MKFTIAIVALLGAAAAIRLGDDSEPEGRNMDTATWKEMHISGYNGADEDEIIDNKMSQVAKEAIGPAGQPTGEKIVWKEDAMKASKDIIKSLKKGLNGK